MTSVHKFLRTLTGGRGFNSPGGDDVCFVKVTGARSGRELNVPLMRVPYEDGVLLVASPGGNPENPVWYHNLVESPDITVGHRGKRMLLRARLARGESRAEADL